MTWLAALDFARKHWRTIVEAIVGGLGVAAMVALGFLLLLEKADNQHNQKVAERKIASLNLTIANVRTKTAQAKADDLTNARTVEHRNETTRQEKASVIQQKLDDALAHTRSVNDGVRRRSAATDSSGGGQSGLPWPGDATGHPADASGASELDAADRLICTANTVKLEGWQDWFAATLKIQNTEAGK